MALPCEHVHWHLVPEISEPDSINHLEQAIIPEMKAAVSLAKNYGFTFGFEHNAPDLMLFADPDVCLDSLRQVPGLGFVWDFNHVVPEMTASFQAMASTVTMLHVSDTILPEVNYHLPLGLGNIQLDQYLLSLRKAGFCGAAILEIGGLPKSGGYGRDTNKALIDSRRRLVEAASMLEDLSSNPD